MSQIVQFRMAMSPDDFKKFYAGGFKQIQVRATDGRLIRFPADAVRKFVTRDGIRGFFEMEFDDRNKLVEIRRLE